MSKERILTVLVPIKDSDCDPTEYENVAALQTAVPASASNVNVIYKVKDGTYYRSYYNGTVYAYKAVVDREFPYLGQPLEIYDFTYDATRMGTAPTISAQNVMWYATKGVDNEDITLDGLWTQECHVVFNGESLYLKQIPTSSKSNEDARYKYDLDFVDDRVILERVYLYDVVSPFITDKPISESATFGFFGDISALVSRINASLIRSGLASLVRKYVGYPQHPSTTVQYLSYEQWNQLNVNGYPLIGDVFVSQAQMIEFYNDIFVALSGNYNSYLAGYIYENTNGVFSMSGYQCVLGNDKYGEPVTSEEKQVQFDKVYIHDALKEVHDTFELEYYITKEKDGNGNFTGNTLIVIADCEYDFADWDDQEEDYVRDDDGIPTTENPFDYGVEDELLSKEKTNTTDKIVSRITGVGSNENIPWYYPNPNPDGWIKPFLTREGEAINEAVIDYPTEPGNTIASQVFYEKYLKNRIGVSINKGAVKELILTADLDSIRTTYVSVPGSPYRDTVYQVTYKIDVTEMNVNVPRMTLELDYNPGQSACSKIYAVLTRGDVTVGTYDSNSTYADPTAFQEMFLYNDGKHKQNLAGGYLYLLRIDFRIPHGETPEPYFNHEGYHYEAQTLDYTETLPSDYTDQQGRVHHYIAVQAKVGENFYQNTGLLPYAVWGEEEREITSTMIWHYFVPVESGYSTDGTAENAVTPIERRKGDWYKDLTSGTTYECNTNTDNNPITGAPSDVFIANPTMSASMWVKSFVSLMVKVWANDGWYVGDDKVLLADYGLSEPYIDNGGGDHTPVLTDIFDKIEFQRLKWLTPQSNLMPEVFIRTDGERRYYNAHNYYPLQAGTPDTAIGEEQVDLTKVRNPLYKDAESDPDNKHYEFENEYSQKFAHEHIENFDDVKPTIKDQRNMVMVTITSDQFNANKTYFYTFDKETEAFVQCEEGDSYDSSTQYYAQLLIDVVEEFAYDLTDNDEIWESSENGSIQGDYKHPWFFAKLRPMGFNIFDMALQEDMEISMTTGNCGACKFKIGVDENSKKNPVQLWEYDVYKGDYLASAEKLYDKGTLRRYVDLTGLYYNTNDTQDGYKPIVDTEGVLEGDKPLNYASNVAIYQRYNYTAEAVENGYVGTMKDGGAVHFEGDVVTNGRFQASQQDTSENHVWVALMKDTETYGTIMPSCVPNYNDPSLNRYIRPKSVADVHVSGSTFEDDEDNADKFVLLNIKMPQIYLRRAEHLLSHKLVEYMYEHNYQKFNFSIKFSRIYIEDNPQTDNNLNENSVLYVMFNNRIYRQYVKSYSYRMSHDAPLPEINVDMNEELSVTKTISQQWDSRLAQNNRRVMSHVNSVTKQVQSRVDRTVMKKDGTPMMSGNIILPGENTSLIEIARRGQGEGGGGSGGGTLQWGEF